jgi:hypothetical protein
VKDDSVRADQHQAGEGDGAQCGGKQPVDLAFDPIVNGSDPGRGLLLRFIVLDKKTGDSGDQTGLLRLQRILYQSARLRFLTLPRQTERLVRGNPELRKPAAERGLSLRAADERREVGLDPDGIAYVSADAVELRCPGV